MIPVIAAALLLAINFGQTGMTLEDVNSFAGASLERAEEILNEASGNSSLTHELVSRAIASERLDLVRLCFESNVSWVYFSQCVLDTPDSLFRDKAMVMALQSGSWFWPNNDAIRIGKNARYNPSLDSLFESTFKKYYPEENYDPIVTQQKKGRLLLAARLENAIAGKYPAPERPSKRTPPQGSSSGNASKHPRRSPSMILGVPENSSEIARSPYIWVLCLGIFGLLTLWIVKRGRRNKGR